MVYGVGTCIINKSKLKGKLKKQFSKSFLRISLQQVKSTFSKRELRNVCIDVKLMHLKFVPKYSFGGY